MRTLLPLVLLLGCNPEGGEPTTEAPGELYASELARETAPSSENVVAVAAGNRAFALDLYGELRNGGENLFYSPWSITSALAMTWAGAEGETETAMAETLHFDLPEAEVHEALNALDLELAARLPAEDGTLVIRPVNQLFAQIGYDFVPAFLDTLALNYGAGVRGVDFGGDPEGTRDLVNGWVADQTEGHIDELVPEGTFDENTKLVLINAVYFLASWDMPFAEANTADRPFTLLDGETISTPTMYGPELSVRYAAGDGWQMVELPYSGDDLACTLLVPDEGRFTDVEDGLDATFFDAAADSMVGAAADLTMPKFELRSKLGLNAPLIELGMGVAFSGDADFSGMSTTSALAIGTVLHEGWVSVNEAGTEAAAATMVEMEDTSVPEVISMVIDRPFIMVLRDRPTGEVLFVGRIMDPRG